jgi:hypothetical protein
MPIAIIVDTIPRDFKGIGPDEGRKVLVGQPEGIVHNRNQNGFILSTSLMGDQSTQRGKQDPCSGKSIHIRYVLSLNLGQKQGHCRNRSSGNGPGGKSISTTGSKWQYDRGFGFRATSLSHIPWRQAGSVPLVNGHAAPKIRQAKGRPSITAVSGAQQGEQGLVTVN